MAYDRRPRQIDISHARRTRGAQRAAASRAAASRAGAQHAASGRTASRAASSRPASRRAAARRRRKKSPLRVFATVMLVLVCLGGIGYGALKVWSMQYFKTGEMGSIDADEVIMTAPEYKGKQLNLLVLGIDYTTVDGEGAEERSKNGNTDMIMYVRMNFENNSMYMMQIPRDTFVGEAGGTAGKINGILPLAVNSGDDNPVSELASYISKNYNLPIDKYVTIDMDSLREIVDVFGGINVYVPYDLVTYDENTGAEIGRLEQGWRVLTGDSLEYFLRSRKAVGMARSDLDRLENQRYFYSALFRRAKTASVRDIVKLMPVVSNYVNTDISMEDAMGIAVKFLSIPSSNIMVCRMPVYGAAQNYNGQSVVVTGKAETAELINEYFLNENDTPLTAADITTPDWPTSGGCADAAVQWMSGIDAEGAGEAGEPVEEKADAAENEAAQQTESSQSVPAA